MTARADQSASHKISDRARLSPAALAAGGVGNLLEWYDFGLYGYFAPVLARLFFPSDDPLAYQISIGLPGASFAAVSSTRARKFYGMARPFGRRRYCCRRFERAGETRCK